jgi:hypothetical protein
MSTGITHPFDDSLYELLDDRTVRITDGERQGIFRGDGRWISGELRQADPQMCVWITNVVLPDVVLESDSHLSRK